MIAKWIIVGVLSLEAVANGSATGDKSKRDPAIFAVCLNLSMIIAILIWWQP